MPDTTTAPTTPPAGFDGLDGAQTDNLDSYVTAKVDAWTAAIDPAPDGENPAD